MARRRSNTVGTKFKEEEALAGNKCYSTASDDVPLVKIIMRRTNKPFRTVDVPSVLTCARLHETVQAQFYIQRDKQILFLRGERLQSSLQSQKRIINLTEHDVLHIHNSEHSQKSVISTSLQFLNQDLVKISSVKITINSCETIRSVVEDVLIYQVADVDKYGFVQSGRYLNLNKTFSQEAIQNDTAILVINRKICASTYTLPQNQNEAESLTPRNGNGTARSNGSVNIYNFHKLEEREMELVESQKRMLKKTSYNDQNSQVPNFKKKCKCNVYKSMLIPESKEIIWEEDKSNSSFSKKILIKKLLRKNRKKSAHLCDENRLYSNITICASSDQDIHIFDPSPRESLDDEIGGKRMTFSESMGMVKKMQMRNFKPPPRMDQFFQQIEELQFGEGDPMEDQEQNNNHESNTLNLNSSAPLTGNNRSLLCSVGKNKGIFVAVINKNAISSSSESDEDG